MTRATRCLIAVLACGAILSLATLGAGAAAVYRSGTVSVAVEDDGGRFRIRIPAGLVHAAIALVPSSSLPREVRQLEPYLDAIDAGCRTLRDAPDFVLAEIRSHEQTVRIEKRDGRLLVAVDEPGTRVRVALPVATVGALVEKLEG